jgi:hypothetical protein
MKRDAVVPMKGNMLYRKGDEIAHAGWPSSAEEPINDEASRVASYQAANNRHPFLPATPYNELVGGIFLPAVLPDYVPHTPGVTPSSGRLPPKIVEGIEENMPLYSEHGATKPFAYLGWPLDSFEPKNDKAKAVVAYYLASKDHPKLLSAPWCRYREDVVLPKLPALPDSKEQKARREEELQKLTLCTPAMQNQYANRTGI